MCGLAGILRTDGEPIPEAWLDALDAAIARRGPDGHGRWRDVVSSDDGGRPIEIALVHRRLAIIDRAGGAQPMRLDDARGTVAVVFNGCIYNHRELRRELERCGHRFRTDHADTEALLHGWREHGTRLPAHVEGMYAFAIWDRAARTLFLARDAFGEKPLWWFRPKPGVVAFASSAAALHDAFPEARMGASADMVAAFLRRGYGWGPGGPGGSSGRHDDHPTALDQIRPASWLAIVDGTTVQEGRHALPPVSDADRPTGALDATDVDRFERALDDAVTARLEADVPLGCFLSGGVDSALVAALARRRAGSLRTFCVRMPDPALDESDRAAAIASHLGTAHTTLDGADADDRAASDDLVELLRTIGVPFGDSSILPTHWVSRAARREISVALSGDGGDELFLGYRRHVAADRVAALAPLLRLIPPAIGVGAEATSRRAILARLGDIARDLPQLGVVAFGAPFPERLVRRLVPAATSPSHASALPAPPGADETTAATLRAHDLAAYLPDDLLLKVDAASMAVALEVRSPLLDRRVAAMALATPIRRLLDVGNVRGRKALLRAVARRHLPTALVDGPKRGFAIPIGRWWRENHGGLGALLRDALGRRDPFGALPIETAAARRLLDDHCIGRADHGQRLFLLLSLSLWARGPG